MIPVFMQHSGLNSAMKSLLDNTAQGLWYDPSDLLTMYQDSTGTTPVTSVEQPVGLIMDKSGKGNHARQTTATSRPILSARYNELVSTEDLTHSSWVIFTTSGGSVNRQLIVGGGPTGKNATKITMSRSSTSTWAQINQPFSTSITAQRKVFFMVKASLPEHAGKLVHYGQYTGSSTINDGSVTLTNDWQAVSVIGDTALSSGTNKQLIIGYISGLPQTGTVEFLVATPDFRVANDGVGLPSYQLVNTSTDYDTTLFPKYLRFDGVDDWMVTNNIDFSMTDNLSLFAGVRKLGTSEGILVEHSSTFSTPNTFGLTIPSVSGDATSRPYIRGGVISPSVPVPVSPASVVLSSNYNNRLGIVSARANGGTYVTATGSGSENFTNYPLYIGRRGGTSITFNGRLYGLMILGNQVSSERVRQAETFMNSNIKAYQP